jgi:hypothetical protein
LSVVTIPFLDRCCAKLAAQGRTALLLVWDNAPWHISHAVQDWIRAPNRQVKREGKGVRLVPCPLPIKSPWLNPIEARPSSHRGAMWREATTRAYYHRASGPSARRPNAARGAPIPGTRRAAVGDRVAGREPAVCPRLLVRAPRVVAESLGSGGSVRGKPTAGPAGVAAQSRRAA